MQQTQKTVTTEKVKGSGHIAKKTAEGVGIGVVGGGGIGVVFGGAVGAIIGGVVGLLAGPVGVLGGMGAGFAWGGGLAGGTGAVVFGGVAGYEEFNKAVEDVQNDAANRSASTTQSVLNTQVTSSTNMLSQNTKEVASAIDAGTDKIVDTIDKEMQGLKDASKQKDERIQHLEREMQEIIKKNKKDEEQIKLLNRNHSDFMERSSAEMKKLWAKSQAAFKLCKEKDENIAILKQKISVLEGNPLPSRDDLEEEITKRVDERVRDLEGIIESLLANDLWTLQRQVNDLHDKVTAKSCTIAASNKILQKLNARLSTADVASFTSTSYAPR